ncbi:RNA-dependent RNA polymerase [Geosmithia morbida]|uniref:RNA-dependent RNA polymerase n=1 Tax=Geosmithia morbida TaxID=1094350 RepID=A0A9P4YYZ6_9HYPO|nr:RNA-dependent RNA polymerase [Geosmithia morbida]KAF4124615.1 RNA-dependent RNA polymerase [Geosmithia morbida]
MPRPKQNPRARRTRGKSYQQGTMHPAGLIPFLPPKSGRSYSLDVDVYPRSIGFGVNIGEQSIKIMKTALPIGNRELKLVLDARSKNLSAYFPLPARSESWSGTREFKFTIDVKQMKTVRYIDDPDHLRCALVISLDFPPQYFLKGKYAYETEDLSQFGDTRPRWLKDRDFWSRTTDVAEDINVPLAYPISLHNDMKDPEHIDIGRWTTFHFVLDKNSGPRESAIARLCSALEELNIRFVRTPDIEILPRSDAIVWQRLNHYMSIEHRGAFALLEHSSTSIHLEFPVRYQLEVCISKGIINEHEITEAFLAKLSEEKPIKARLRLEFAADQGKRLKDPMEAFTNPNALEYAPNVGLPHYCTLVRKANVTPTTVRFSTPVAETSNRVLRKYDRLQDRFLRVQFLEESEKGKIGMSRGNNEAIYTRLLRTLYQGIRIGDRTYEFLAFGSSQLKECGVYFFCPTQNTSCDDIRQWMGEFNHIKIIAKYTARVGQCFSTTREIKGIRSPTVCKIPDIERNGYCFTDGVGIISSFLARIIMEDMRINVPVEPSAFQFRMGGCKGVLAVWPRAKGMEVHIRKSQEKFKTDFNSLEIIRHSKFSSASLNRQTIVLLEALGVPSSVFETLLDQQLRQFEAAMDDTSMALRMLAQFVDENQVTLIISKLLRAGFVSNSIKEPFVVSVLHLWRSWSLKLLKEKARIQVGQSAFVLGCVDETGSLRGHSFETESLKRPEVDNLPQIFLQITDPTSPRKTIIIEGICAVGRNPSLHPGDIRVVNAVNEPKLHHLRDVVVFPKTGDRPVPNMLSGGDLDGDDYFVIWDQRLIPKEWNFKPMNYTGIIPEELNRDVNVNDMREFFVSYVKNDVLGLVATAHLGLADKEGPKSPKCLLLAELHSQAVDFPKTGHPAEWNESLQPRAWPHFMEKTRSYRSGKALGRIFDKVSEQPVEFRPEWEHGFDKRILNHFGRDPALLVAARVTKVQYDTSVRRILAQHGVATEFELWTGFAMSKPTVGTDYKRQEQLGREYDSLRQRFREICYQEAGGRDAESVDRFVVAMYQVTEEQVKAALAEQNQVEHAPDEDTPAAALQALDASSMPLISFPWIFHSALIRIAHASGLEADK